MNQIVEQLKVLDDATISLVISFYLTAHDEYQIALTILDTALSEGKVSRSHLKDSVDVVKNKQEKFKLLDDILIGLHSLYKKKIETIIRNAEPVFRKADSERDEQIAREEDSMIVEHLREQYKKESQFPDGGIDKSHGSEADDSSGILTNGVSSRFVGGDNTGMNSSFDH